jgi:hypothetical protein
VTLTTITTCRQRAEVIQKDYAQSRMWKTEVGYTMETHHRTKEQWGEMIAF